MKVLLSLKCETNDLETSCTACEVEALLYPTP